MNVVCLGISHHTAGVDVRERFAVGPGELPGTLRRLREIPGVAEAVLLSTCNRVEYYLVVTDQADPAALRAEGWLRPRGPAPGAVGTGAVAGPGSGAAAGSAHLPGPAGPAGPLAPPPAEEDGFCRYHDAAGVRHLLRVVSGLESMVIGETEILGQVKQAYQTASACGTVGKVLHKLFQRAFQAAKQVRSQTSVGRGAVSVGSVAVDLAEKIFGDLRERRVLILGAGEIGERTARSLRSRGARSILVSNRHHERAVALARELEGQAVRFDAWEQEVAAGCDILIGSTAAPHFVVTRARLEPLLRRRPDRPLFVIDLAVPRDVEPGVNDLEGVYLYDIDSLETIARQARDLRAQELAAGEALIATHVEQFMVWADRERSRGHAGHHHPHHSPAGPAAAPAGGRSADAVHRDGAALPDGPSPAAAAAVAGRAGRVPRTVPT